MKIKLDDEYNFTDLWEDIKVNVDSVEMSRWEIIKESMDDVCLWLLPGWLYRLPRNIKDTFYRKPKLFLQRGFKGHTCEDWWNIDSFVIMNCLPLVKKLRKDKNGWSSQFESEEQWNKILDDIIEGWTLWHADMNGAMLNERDYKKIEKANKLFGQHLSHMWD